MFTNKLVLAKTGRRSKGVSRRGHTDVPDEDDEPTLAAYCSVCAYVEFGGSSGERTDSDADG